MGVKDRIDFKLIEIAGTTRTTCNMLSTYLQDILNELKELNKNLRNATKEQAKRKQQEAKMDEDSKKHAEEMQEIFNEYFFGAQKKELDG